MFIRWRYCRTTMAKSLNGESRDFIEMNPMPAIRLGNNFSDPMLIYFPKLP